MKDHINEILSNNKPSIYLFGSVVLDDFQLGWSDIDILCLTGQPISEDKAEQLVKLRQTLLEQEPGNQYFRSFEGGMLSLAAFLNQSRERAVYWGTSGQRITENYVFDPFSLMELIDSGRLLSGDEIRQHLKRPTYEELKAAVVHHYEAIRKYAVHTNRTLYSPGWLLDIARCLYTLETGKIIAKTAAGEWALQHHLAPNPEVLQRAVDIRKNPLKYKYEEAVLDWTETLGKYVHEFADVLEHQIARV
jgi:hypothetical protein